MRAGAVVLCISVESTSLVPLVSSDTLAGLVVLGASVAKAAVAVDQAAPLCADDGDGEYTRTRLVRVTWDRPEILGYSAFALDQYVHLGLLPV